LALVFHFAFDDAGMVMMMIMLDAGRFVRL
jgi:hypothetical protein